MNLLQHFSRRVLLSHANGLYSEAEDRKAAIQLSKAVVSSGRRMRQELSDTEALPTTKPSSTQSQGSVENVSEEQIAHNVAMRSKDSN